MEKFSDTMGTGSAMTRVPVMAHIEPTTRPITVLGVTSPYLGHGEIIKGVKRISAYPTVVMVMAAHQKASTTLWKEVVDCSFSDM